MVISKQRLCDRINTNIELVIDEQSGGVTYVNCPHYNPATLRCAALGEFGKYWSRTWKGVWYGSVLAPLAWVGNELIDRHYCQYRKDELKRRRELSQQQKQNQ